MIFAGKLAVGNFLLGSSSALLYLLASLSGHDIGHWSFAVYLFLAGHCLTVNLLIHNLLKGFQYQVAVRAALLGSAFACGLLIAITGSESFAIFGCYVCVLSFFHCSEFVAIAVCNPDTLKISSFVLNHSRDYKIAAAISWAEFFIELYFWPGLKRARIVPAVGLTLCVGGELLRKVAMVTASKSFTHLVVSEKADHHVLITNGVYAIFRHPSYVGWFYWAIGSQLILANPFCVLAYTLASWKFFNDRITVEELTLLSFFGERYVQYQKQVPIGLPFIKGYSLAN